MGITDNNYIHPEDGKNLLYWSRKWGVSQRELIDAILYTGSLDTSLVRTYLRRDSWFYHPVTALKKLFFKTYELIF